MPSGRMEVGHAIFRLVGNAHPLQVLLDHEPSLLAIEVRKKLLTGWDALEPLSEHPDQIWVQWQDILAAMLRAARLHGYSRWNGIEVETPHRKARQFLLSQPCHVGQSVNACSLFTIKTLNRHSAVSSGSNETTDFLGCQSSSLAPDVDFLIEPLHTDQRIDEQPFCGNTPVEEGIHRLEVMVERPVSQILLTAEGS
nr:hypothetical protein [Symmachiella dynata]